MRGKEISKIAVGAGLLSMLLACGARAEDKDLPGPIDSIEDLQDVGKLLFKLADTNGSDGMTLCIQLSRGPASVASAFSKFDIEID